MPATPNAQQAAQEQIGQEMASSDKPVAESAAPSTASSSAESTRTGSEPEEDRTGLIEEIEAPEVDSQTQMAYAHMRANAGGGAGAQPGV